MKRYLFPVLLLAGFSVVAQPKLVTQATISTVTTVIAPEDEDAQNNAGAGGRMNFANMMDGETKSTTWLKNEQVKTLLKSDVLRSTVYRNNATKITTTLIEVMGTKQAFYISDSEQTELRRKADSMMQSRKPIDSLSEVPAEKVAPVIEVAVAGETKKIAGYNCKKAYVITTRLLGLKDSVTVWYTPEIKLQNVVSTGGLSAFGNMGTVSGLEKIEGFVMRYEMGMRGNRRMEVEVSKIDTNKDIADKEFEIPKDIDIKPMREMQRMFGGGMPRN